MFIIDSKEITPYKLTKKITVNTQCWEKYSITGSRRS